MCVCKDNKYSNEKTEKCEKCHYSCPKCSGKTKDECDEEKGCNEASLMRKIVVSKNDDVSCVCKDGYYDNGSDAKCEKCGDFC